MPVRLVWCVCCYIRINMLSPFRENLTRSCTLFWQLVDLQLAPDRLEWKPAVTLREEMVAREGCTSCKPVYIRGKAGEKGSGVTYVWRLSSRIAHAVDFAKHACLLWLIPSLCCRGNRSGIDQFDQFCFARREQATVTPCRGRRRGGYGRNLLWMWTSTLAADYWPVYCSIHLPFVACASTESAIVGLGEPSETTYWMLQAGDGVRTDCRL